MPSTKRLMTRKQARAATGQKASDITASAALRIIKVRDSRIALQQNRTPGTEQTFLDAVNDEKGRKRK